MSPDSQTVRSGSFPPTRFAKKARACLPACLPSSWCFVWARQLHRFEVIFVGDTGAIFSSKLYGLGNTRCANFGSYCDTAVGSIYGTCLYFNMSQVGNVLPCYVCAHKNVPGMQRFGIWCTDAFVSICDPWSKVRRSFNHPRSR